MNTEDKIAEANKLHGVVVSDKMRKTIVVLVRRQVKHPKYRKYIRKTTKIHAHDEKQAARIGDHVLIRESRPISRTKSWVLEKIVESSAVREAA